jgi:putative ATP-dependent endonuclease of OLD family
MKAREDEFVKVFHGQKTFEYDFGLVDKNRHAMLAALKEIHPTIGKNLENVVNAEVDDRAKATALFKGMFERAENNVQKGKFAQALAAKIADEKLDISVPDYILAAIKHACQK